jgi:hypothetical protein
LLRRLMTVVAALTAAATLALPALARPNIVAQRTSHKGVGGVLLKAGLTPGHRYKIEISSPAGHVKFEGVAGSFYSYTANNRFATGNKSFQYQGKTPRSFTMDQPIKGVTIEEWLYQVQVQDAAGKSLTVRIFDMGKHA